MIAILGLCAPAAARDPPWVAPATEPRYVGNEACAACHRSIYASYSRTAMARTSGPARPNLIEGTFQHALSGVEYRVFAEGDQAYLAYGRPGDPGLRGREELLYYVGSNSRGRTFLFEIEGLLYQSPINYYAKSRSWDMSPGYQSLRAMELNHPAPPSCLFCHASQVQASAPGAPNRYAGAPFLQAGVGCERCHGPGGDHVLGKSPLVVPTELMGERRESVCAQCHLEGQAAVRRPGKTPQMYRPGDRLADFTSIFVYQDAGLGSLGAVSQVEALARSRCKLRSGDRLSCTTCHDPHTSVAPEARAAYYRQKCLLCHAAPFAKRHPQEAADCLACHMPRHESADIRHTQVTDHRILRRPEETPAAAPPESGRELVPFGTARSEPRELGLAYAQVALRGDPHAAQEAVRLLQDALPRYPRDADVLTRLGFLYQEEGQEQRASQMYERALDVDPDEAVAASNLAEIYATHGDLQKAIPLWARTFAQDHGKSEVGVDLSIALEKEGHRAAACQTLVTVLRHNPDLGQARAMLRDLETVAGQCPAAAD